MSRAIDSRVTVSGDTKSTECDTKSTECDILTTLRDILTTFLCHFTTLRDTVQKSTYVGSSPIF